MSIARQLNRKLNRALADAEDELQSIGNDWARNNRRVVSDWTNKPKFQVRVDTSNSAYIDLLIIATGEHAPLWYWTDLGTKPHKIRAKNAPALLFQSNYSARTLPIAKFKQGTGLSSGSWNRRQEVNHPGTEARKFTETYANDNEAQIITRISNRLKRSLR